jgi:CubicO group peptidase (beta-lactamase class C family)
MLIRSPALEAPMSSPSFPLARPEDVGLSSPRLARISAALAVEVAAGRIPGAVVGVMRGGKLAHLSATGFRDVATKAPMTTDTLFSIASMTKPMTSAALMMLVEDGRVLLGDPVSAYLPELKGMKVAVALAPDKLETRASVREPTVQDLLRHTSGITYSDRGSSAAHKTQPGGGIKGMIGKSKAETLAQLGSCALLFDPGTQWEYGFSTDVAGFVVEAVSGQSLGAFLTERLWHPLGMTDTGFNLAPDKAGRYAHALALDPLTGAKQYVHHAHAHEPKWQSGGGGGLSSVGDYLRFADMLRGHGTAGGKQLLGRGTVKLMTADHLPAGLGARIADSMDPAAAGYGFGLGFAVRLSDGVAAMAGSKGDYYWSGVYGTYFWVDPIEDLVCVFMAAAPGLIRLRYRQMLRNLVYQALN